MGGNDHGLLGYALARTDALCALLACPLEHTTAPPWTRVAPSWAATPPAWPDPSQPWRRAARARPGGARGSCRSPSRRTTRCAPRSYGAGSASQ